MKIAEATDPSVQKSTRQQLNDARDTFVSGAIAAITSRCVTAPFDRIKLLAQEGRFAAKAMGKEGTHVAPSLVTLAKSIFREGGVTAFWRGNWMNVLKVTPELALVFSSRALIDTRVEHFRQRRIAGGHWLPPKMVTNVLAASVAGCLSQLAIYPLEVVRTRLAVGLKGEYRGISDCVIQSYRHGGFFGFYCGLTVNLLGIMPYRGLEIGTFFTLRECFSDGNAKISSERAAVIGAFSTCIAQTATYPFNLVRTKLQTQGVNGRPRKHSGMLNVVVYVVRTEGVRGLYRGLLANTMKAVPTSATAFVVYEWSMAHVRSWRRM